MSRKIYRYDLLDSTNIKAKELADTEVEGTVILAEEQTQGKGRLGRSWVSQKGKGIYMSMILKPKVDVMSASRITLIGAAAVHLSLKELDINTKIKWPNDIQIGDKKVCGILTEMNGDLNNVNYVVMGIGVNVNLDENDIPENIKERATSLKIFSGKSLDKEKLLELILDYFDRLYLPFKEKGDMTKVLDICRKNSSVIGKAIRVIKGNEIRLGKALYIDENGELVVEFEDGIENINSGEVSVR